MLHQIGVGALGPVFRTYEPTRDRLVAVKAFRLDITPELAQSLADELSKAAEAGLFHPSIVEPIAAGVEGTVAYRADEYVAAETLDVAMRHYAPAPIEKVLPFITQLAGAIDFARTAGVGHGAMHPRDIFVTPEEARASGFGVVEALERVGLRAPVRRPYTAPERVAGGAWGAPADVFSLAVIAYELLTSRRPSGTGSQIGAIGGQHAAGIHAVLVQAMDDDPSRRPQSALSFASALDRASRGETTAPVAAAAPVPAVAPLPRVDDAVAPAPPAGVDRGEALAFDDIAEERDEDEAHVALTLDELHAGEGPGDAADPSFFDDEAVEDLALEPADGDDPARFSDDFAPAPNPPAGPPAPPPPLFGSVAPATSYGDEPVVVYERGGLLTAPVIVTVALALLVGFAGGYAVGSRAGATGPGDTVAGTTQETGTTPAQPQTAKPYSEQAVSPPAEPPRPAGEAAPVTGGSVPPAAGGAVPSPSKPAPAAPVATTGRVEVRSTPPGASVTVDGVWRGRTPLTLENLRFGQYAIRVVQQGYAVVREEVRLTSATPSRSLSFKLQRSTAPRPIARPAPVAPARPDLYTGSIYVDSRPRGARVLVDGKFMGTTPVRIPDLGIGSHVVRLQLADHRDWTSSTRVIAGEESRVTGSLERNR